MFSASQLWVPFVLLVVGAAVPAVESAAVDADGDGRSDYSVARAVPATLERGAVFPDSSPDQLIEWHFARNGISWSVGFGQAETDFLTPADFDGDGKTDVAIWRTGPAEVASFYILESSTGKTRREIFGQVGDDPLIVGDYDGDGRADPAVFRCPERPGQCIFYFRASANNPEGQITYIPWGFGTATELFPNPGDFDGDGKFDFCVQRADPENPERGQFLLLRSSDWSSEVFAWGLADDRIAPGDFNGDGRNDYVVVRSQEGRKTWYGSYSDGTGGFEIVWGGEQDYLTPGDYDGDGVTDVSVWRPESLSAETGLFTTLRSSDGETEFYSFGQAKDYPLAEAQVH